MTSRRINSITIAWAGTVFHYTYHIEDVGGMEITYIMSYAKGTVVLVRDLQKDSWSQHIRPGDARLPANFINVVGQQILIDQRPKQK
jgi:hypothetical protein